MERDDPTDEATRRTARLLVTLGVVPFAVLSVWLAAIARDHIWRDGTILLLSVYAAAVLSFVGGTRWGMTIARPGTPHTRDLFTAALAPLLGWLGVAMPAPYSFGLLAVAFAAHGAWDTLAAHGGQAPDWYARLRAVATTVAVAGLILALVATS